MLALVGIVAGLGLAWVSAAALFQTLSDGAISYPETSVVTGVVIPLVGLAGGLAAAWFQARSASKSDLLAILRAD